MHAHQLKRPNGTSCTRTAPRGRCGRRGPHRSNELLRTHDRLASQHLRTHPTAKQLPLTCMSRSTAHKRPRSHQLTCPKVRTYSCVGCCLKPNRERSAVSYRAYGSSTKQRSEGVKWGGGCYPWPCLSPRYSTYRTRHDRPAHDSPAADRSAAGLSCTQYCTKQRCTIGRGAVVYSVLYQTKVYSYYYVTEGTEGQSRFTKPWS